MCGNELEFILTSRPITPKVSASLNFPFHSPRWLGWLTVWLPPSQNSSFIIDTERLFAYHPATHDDSYRAQHSSVWHFTPTSHPLQLLFSPDLLYTCSAALKNMDNTSCYFMSTWDKHQKTGRVFITSPFRMGVTVDHWCLVPTCRRQYTHSNQNRT